MRLKHSVSASPRKCVIQSTCAVQHTEAEQGLHHSGDSRIA